VRREAGRDTGAGRGAADLLEEDDARLALVAEPRLADPEGLLQVRRRAGEVLLDRDACRRVEAGSVNW
jgi:hypothetical protein